jgi:predicted MPP superfamily phosphohydrolase
MTPNGTVDDPSAPPIPQAGISRRAFLRRNLAVVAAFGGGHGYAEGARLSVTRHRVPMPGLTATLRVAQLTDLHRSWCVSDGFLRRVVERVNALRPDIVALTGDYVTLSSSYAGPCAQILARLVAPMGRFAVLGNHDYGCDKHAGRGHLGAIDVSRALESAGITLLTRPDDLVSGHFIDRRPRNTNLRLPNGLQIVGIDDASEGLPDCMDAYRGIDPRAPILTLAHNPLFFGAIQYWGRSNRFRRCVTLSGHTHGGQVNLPFVTRQTLLREYPNTAGWGPGPDSPICLYVSRGIGTISIPIRIRSLPEIALFELTPA